MKIHSLGHACWLIETSMGNILTDPVFDEYFEGNTVQHCPSRKIVFNKLPTIDLLYISHRHLDHFHIPTLQMLPKDTPVLIPDDPLSIAALERLGFTDIRTMQAFSPIKFSGLTIHPIPSPSTTFLEYAALFVDGSYTLFNQVDTPLNEQAFDYIQQNAPSLDCHFAMFASQEFGWFSGKLSESAEIYTQNLRTVQRLNAKSIIPAAAGFRFIDEHSYLNSFLFPISHKRFIQDISSLMPNKIVLDPLPGDIITLSDMPKILKQTSPYCSCIKDDRHLLMYNPTAVIPDIIDRNHSEYPPEHLAAYPKMFIEKAFISYLQSNIKDEVIKRYHDLSIGYQVEIVTPTSNSVWSFQFTPDSVSVIPSTDFAAQVKWKITASSFIDLCEGKKSCFGIRPNSRKFSTLLYAKNTHNGIIGFEETISDLLTHFILNMRIRVQGEEEALLNYYGLTVASCQ
jgi:UDP-MurNAc hydroxylase